MARILLAEDHEPTRQALGLFLQGSGHGVVFSGDGEKALRTARRGGIDLIITDIAMPKLTGEEFIKRLQQEAERARRLPVIFITGLDEAELASVRALMEKYPQTRLHSKPLDELVLLKDIEALTQPQ